MNIVLQTDISDIRWAEALPDIETIAQQVKDAVFSYLDAHEHLDFLRTEKNICINLCLSDDAYIHQLNRDFRQIDRPTNVLSFANLDFEDFERDNNLFDEVALGDIVIAFETMQREAGEQQVTLHAHFCHLLTHGLLHLAGYDHQTADEAAQMEGIEIAVLAHLNIANPYTEEIGVE